jgi:hypothetical protein
MNPAVFKVLFNPLDTSAPDKIDQPAGRWYQPADMQNFSTSPKNEIPGHTGRNWLT